MSNVGARGQVQPAARRYDGRATSISANVADALAYNAIDVRIIDLDDLTARAVGRLCGLSGHADVVDVHVVLNALEHGHRIVTSDPTDLSKVDPSIALIVV